MWAKFQEDSLGRLRAAAGPDFKETIVWTSHLTTAPYMHYLPKEDYVIQLWTDATVRINTWP